MSAKKVISIEKAVIQFYKDLACLESIEAKELQWKPEKLSVKDSTNPKLVIQAYEDMLRKAQKRYWVAAGLRALQLTTSVVGHEAALMHVAICLIRNGKWDSAIQVLARIANGFQDSKLNYTALLLLGLASFRSGNPLDRLNYLFRAAASEFHDDRAQLYLAGALGQLGFMAEAENVLNGNKLSEESFRKILGLLSTVLTSSELIGVSKVKNRKVTSKRQHRNSSLPTEKKRQCRKRTLPDNSIYVPRAKMNLCLKCSKFETCLGQVPYQASWERQSWYCPGGYTPKSDITIYDD